MSKNISKYFASLKKAESFQWRLYDKHNSVVLIRAPRFEEAGIYVWEVR